MGADEKDLRQFLYNNVYSLIRWRKLREDFYIYKGGICDMCGIYIIRRPRRATFNVHHITELTADNYKDDYITYNYNNLMLLHVECHNKIHNRYQKNEIIADDKINFKDRQLKL